MTNSKITQMCCFCLIGIFSVLISNLYAQQTKSNKDGGPIRRQSTETKPINKQHRDVFSNPEHTVFFSNNFSGGAFSRLTTVNDTAYRILIEPENLPINSSPWYAFKVWSTMPKTIHITLEYVKGKRHRYAPKISSDGKNWKLLEKPYAGDREKDGSYRFKLDISKDTTWISAQPLLTVAHVNQWTDSLLKLDIGAKKEVIGESRNKRPLEVVKIGNPKSKRAIVLITRQHPPEVTGHQAFMAFVETLIQNNAQAKAFRKNFMIYLFPMVNPDGVEEGFWRHNAGGVDLNRDWEDFNQPETRAIRDYLKKDISADRQVNLFIDFHSIWSKDLYYTLQDTVPRNTSGILKAWLSHLEKTFPEYKMVVKPVFSSPPPYPAFASFGYFYETYKAEAVIYEISDNTPKDFIVAKAKASAEKLMELLLQEAHKSK